MGTGHQPEHNGLRSGLDFFLADFGPGTGSIGAGLQLGSLNYPPPGELSFLPGLPGLEYFLAMENPSSIPTTQPIMARVETPPVECRRAKATAPF